MTKVHHTSEKEALALALDRELKTRKFYLDSADKTEGLAKKTLLFLADEELKHADVIKEFSESMLDGGAPDIDSGTEDEAGLRSREFFRAAVDPTRIETAKAIKDEASIYESGMDFELRDFNLYKKAAEEAKHDNLKKLFEFLAKEEEGHYHLLQNALSYIKDPQHYFQTEEEWFFEGG